MKRTERHHLKQNELQIFARQARDTIEARRRETTVIVVLAAVVGALAVGYFGWREHVQSVAHGLLAQAMIVQDARIGPPPAPGTPANGLYFPTERERSQAALTKFKVAADAYPSTDAGIFARYQEAAIALALGDPAHATTAYQLVIEKAGDGLRPDGPAGAGGSAGARRQVRSGDQYLQGARATERRSAADRWDSDAARAHLSRGRQAGRCATDVQQAGRRVSRVALHGGCAKRARDP